LRTRSGIKDIVTFLENYELRAVNLGDPQGLKPFGLAIGKGANALEVLVAEARSAPTVGALRNVWKARLAGRATPLLLVVLYDGKAALCGPAGDQPAAYASLDPGAVERICSTALDEPDRHASLRFLRSVIPQLDSGPRVSALTNEGLFATHELQRDVPHRKDWATAGDKARPALKLRGQALVRALGYSVEALPGPAYVLRSADTKLAVAVFLERNESPDAPNARFSNLSAISYALAQADRENLDYVLISYGSALRLYPARTGIGTGRRGRTETFIQVHLDLLPEEDAGYLWLLFSAEALHKGGSFEKILSDSARYAADLGSRLRDRVYNEVIPPLSQSLLAARGLRSPNVEDLQQTYQMALVVLFRLLFIAYAEDKDLLPYKDNALYRDRSLKKKANELIEIAKSKTPFGNSTILWEEIDHLFRAVDEGRAEWGVPAYNGGLFARKPEVSQVGAALASVKLPDHVFGPVLHGLLVDRTPEGWGPVDFRSLGVREFGTIYEGLLENELSIAEADLTTEVIKKEEHYRPAKADEEVRIVKGRAYLHTRSGARKATGSFFTKHFAVEHLLDHALEPALADHLARLDRLSERDAGEVFFDFRVADLAMGSGHFLVAAVDHIERSLSGYLVKRPLPDVMDELARLRTSAIAALGSLGDGVEIEDTQLLRRQIARRCIYGVDLNPIAVELARLGLWVHTFVPGLPLSFLDHNLVVGNSLVGIATLAEASEWLKEILGSTLFALSAEPLIGTARKALDRLARLSDANAAEVEEARRAFAETRKAVAPAAVLLDVLTAARISEDVRVEVFHQAAHWMETPETVLGSKAGELANEILEALPPFHFPIAFAEVFLRAGSGFDVIVGNPPWEKVRVEEHEFWARHAPGLRGLKKADRDTLVGKMRRTRPDLVAAWEHERATTERMRDAVRFLPGMSTGHPDLFRAFTLRFVKLARQDGGKLGVVLPGDAFKIAGCADVREGLTAACANIFPQMLTNKRGWVFDDVHPQKLVALVSATVRPLQEQKVVQLTPEFHDRASWDRRDLSASIEVSFDFLRAYSTTLVLPLLPAIESMDVVQAIMRSPALVSHPALLVRRVYADFETSRDRGYWHARNSNGDWPVYAGESFDLWDPDTGQYYAFTDSKTISEAAQQRWNRAPRTSPYAQLPITWRQNPENHPIGFPRVAFRNVTNRTNTRTLIAALIPARVVTVEVAPWVLWLDPSHPLTHEAYLLGVMSSLPLDWWSRRFIEGHADQEAFNCLRVPDPRPHTSLAKRVVALSGRLACPDKRYREWAAAVGVEYGKLDDAEKVDMIHELDAVVAHLYGLSDKQLAHIFETFHEGWDYEEHLRETMKHFAAWKKKL
jgi:hypothetical protein